MTRKLISFIIAASVLAGCTFPNVVSPYKLDIPQGNTVTADQATRLKPGMTRSQVRFILGSPLLADPFHTDRWDYIHSDARNGKLQQKKIFTVIFENDKLARVEGETLPAAKPILSASAPASAASAPAAKKE
jgi:outer membrane protein assembly factor BamE